MNGLVVLDQWERVVEMVEECAPLFVLLGLSESDRVVVWMFPLNEQQVVARGSNVSDRLRHPGIDVVMTLAVAKARSKSSSLRGMTGN